MGDLLAGSSQRLGEAGEWNWVIDADQADLCYRRIAEGWDRYGNIAVPPPA